jgi:pimeloyl-ACP methyl ester carboxylesterase
MTVPPARSQISVTLDGRGSPVLLLHGLGGDQTQSLGLLPDDLHVTRIAPELPGHGQTDLLDTEPVGFAPFTSLVAASIDRLQDTGRIPGNAMPVVGISMGAGIYSAWTIGSAASWDRYHASALGSP